MYIMATHLHRVAAKPKQWAKDMLWQTKKVTPPNTSPPRTYKMHGRWIQQTGRVLNFPPPPVNLLVYRE